MNRYQDCLALTVICGLAWFAYDELRLHRSYVPSYCTVAGTDERICTTVRTFACVCVPEQQDLPRCTGLLSGRGQCRNEMCKNDEVHVCQYWVETETTGVVEYAETGGYRYAQKKNEPIAHTDRERRPCWITSNGMTFDRSHVIWPLFWAYFVGVLALALFTGLCVVWVEVYLCKRN